MTVEQSKQILVDEKEIKDLKAKVEKLEAAAKNLVGVAGVPLPEPKVLPLTREKIQRLKDKLTEEERNFVGLGDKTLVPTYTLEEILSFTGEQIQALVDANRITFEVVPGASPYWKWRADQPKVEAKLEPKVEIKK